MVTHDRSAMLDNYRRYMLGRRYARSTVDARLRVARAWLARFPDLRARHGDVERWVLERPLSAGAARNEITDLRALYRWAMRDGLVEVDATALVDRARIPRRLPRPARDSHIVPVLAAADPPLRAMVALMACAGLRCVEVAGLSWCDVDLAAGTVIVMGKGSRERLLSLSADVLRLLAALDGVDGPVFVGRWGQRRTPARISQVVCQAFRAAGYGDTAHQLRHRCATVALQLPDVDLLAVRDLLGHATVSTTQQYTAVLPGRTSTTSRALGLPV